VLSAVPSSSKSHDHPVASLDASVNCTVSGASPDVGVALNAADGAVGSGVLPPPQAAPDRTHSNTAMNTNPYL